MNMYATATAQPNIALIKYWGKRDIPKNLPAVGSISITLNDLFTEVCVNLKPRLSEDELIVNGERNIEMLPRIASCIDNILGEKRSRVQVSSKSNFPIAAGLASSASVFAAITKATNTAAGLNYTNLDLAKLAGQASGSAARSLYGGFVELKNAKNSIEVKSLCDASSWPLQVVIAITETEKKAIGSSLAMEISRKTSPFYKTWITQQDQDLETARNAIKHHDFDKLATVTEHSCLKMHSVMWASRPSLIYWNSATVACMQKVRKLQHEGFKVFFTIDAGPQVKAICLKEHSKIVREELEKTPGVKQVMESSLGAAARVVGSS
jgi:diphosphomevalonate decarboxylase